MAASIVQYLDRIISEYRNQPNFLSVVEIEIRDFVQNQNTVLGLPALFDVDVAVGQQLDFTGEWIGLTRFIVEPVVPVYFSLDTPGAGLDQAVWEPPPPLTISTAVVALDDNDYRTLLKARILANTWDGTTDGAYAAWNYLFNPRGFQVFIQENTPGLELFFSLDIAGLGCDQAAWYNTATAGNYAFNDMSIILLIMGAQPLDPLTKSLFTGGYLELWDAGVSVEYMQPTVVGASVFALDAGPETGPVTYPPTPFAGLDRGVWAEDIVTSV
jgi:hypothetical protein